LFKNIACKIKNTMEIINFTHNVKFFFNDNIDKYYRL